jgi:alcohol dehydrogenase class IV
MKEYDLRWPPRVVFGWGRLRELAAHAAPLGRRAFLVHGSRRLEQAGYVAAVREQLTAAGIAVVEAACARGEPTVEQVDELAGRLRAQHATSGDFVLALGGGSAIDLAKAAAATAVQPTARSVRDYLEDVGSGAVLDRPPLPLVVLPTTGGTGSEATRNAVISGTSPEPFKKSLRHEALMPRLVLIDPQLAAGLPPQITAWSAMDCITQLIESYVCRFARPVPQALAALGLREALAHAEDAYATGARAAREAMAHAAFLSGVALANSGLGIAHGVAAALGARHHIPHGLACAVLLPWALRVNRNSCLPALAALARAALPDGHVDDATAADMLLQRVEQLVAALHIPARLGELGIQAHDLPGLAAASHGNSRNGNPRPFDDAELASLLAEHL